MTAGVSSPSVSPWSGDLELITSAAMAAGRRALDFFGKEPEVWWKHEGRSPVSAADFAANDILKEHLLTARPHYGWLSEETDDDESRLHRETVFVVDPIDGTRAFINGRKVWCVSVAVVHRGRPVAAALYAPALDELFTAILHGPALKNGDPIEVSAPAEGALRRLAASEDLVRNLDPAYRPLVERMPHVPSLAYRLAMVADGRLEGTIVKVNSHDWDLAAADLILDRAGGKVAGLSGNPLFYNRATVRHDVLCAASNAELGPLLQAARGLDGH